MGPYEIVSPLGAGGMGEVYRARDTRLDRTVAIKVLNAALSASPDLKARFEREARAISQLNHPNICTLHDVGNESGTDYLVMEYLEGESLADRLRKGPFPLDQLVKIGCEIADALDKAHRAGIVHRDLKPGNVMLTKMGAKLLDFGLAKPAAMGALAGSGSAPLLSAAMTMTSPSPHASPLTSAGMLVGTIQYMSPEQLQGIEADARSDIFAFGAVLYEMATGRRAFEGKSQIKVASAILEDQPASLTSLQPAAPAAFEHLIHVCLDKNPDERLQSAHDLKLQLLALGQSEKLASRERGVAPARLLPWAGWAIAALALVALSVVWALHARSPARASLVRFSIAVGGRRELAVDATLALAISEDGTKLAYVAADSGVTHLYVRPLDRLEAMPIAESDGATFPFFSPDGQWIGFFSQGKLRKAPIGGGNSVAICELPSMVGATWMADDTIVVASGGRGLVRVPASGGEPSKIVVQGKDRISPSRPFAIPGSEWIGFTNYVDTARIVAANMRTGELKTLLDNADAAQFAGDRLVYYASGALWAVPMNTRSMTTTGAAQQITAGVAEINLQPQFAVTPADLLAFAPGTSQDNSTRNLVLVDRAGVATKLDVPAEDYVDPAVAPDGKRFAIAVRRVGDQTLAVFDSERGVLMRLPSGGLRFAAPVWTPDSKYLVFDAPGPSQHPTLYRVLADGSAPPEAIVELPANGHVTSIAPTGQAVVMINNPATNMDLWLLALDGDHKLKAFRNTPAMERQGSFSPDGAWIAYSANDSGRSEVYVSPIRGAGRWQISVSGGEQPRWSRDGREIFYRLGSKMMLVAVETRAAFSARRPVELFDVGYDRGGAVPGYDSTPDGKVFLMTRSEQPNPTEVHVVMGWLEELKQTTPRK
jgi:Tol biopolymer transport system component